MTIESMSSSDSQSRGSAPARTLQVYVAVHLALSFVYMYYFCRHFGFSRRLAVLHLSTVAGPMLAVVFVSGLMVALSRRQGRLLEYVIAAVYGAWATILALLYIAHFVGDSLWGNNVNYQLVSHYLLRRRIAEDDGISIPPWMYLALAVLALAIAVVHLALASKLLKSLQFVFLPERSSSVFHGRRRTLTSFLVFALVITAYGAYVHALPRLLSEEWRVQLEPITSFFQLDLYDMSHTALAERLRVEEPRARANYPSGQAFDRKNVIVVIVDSLRRDHMQVYGYHRPTTPFLQSLVDSGRLQRVEFATSTCAESNCGILSTLSSKTLPAIIPEDFKLHDLLHDQGYETYFILSGDHDWYGLKKSYGQSLTYYIDNTTSERYRGVADDHIVSEGLEHVPDFSGSPAFFYFHLMSVHISGVKHAEFRRYQPADVGHDWTELIGGHYDVTALTNNYDNGVIEADATIRQIFDSLKTKGYLDRSMVVILADHGEGLGERPKDFGHGRWLYQEFIRIPLLVYNAGGPALANLKFATQIDVAPTIVDSLGLQIPSSWQGRSLLRPGGSRFTFHQTSLLDPSFAVIGRLHGSVYQYLYRVRDRREELYDLTSDPTGTQNLLSSAEPPVIDEMRARLDEYRAQR